MQLCDLDVQSLSGTYGEMEEEGGSFIFTSCLEGVQVVLQMNIAPDSTEKSLCGTNTN